MRRLLSILLVLATVLGLVSMTALAANPFIDVPKSEWYYADIDHAYQNGLINGKTPTEYKPNDYLTYAEAVKLAAAMNQRYITGAVTLQNGTPWYQTYVDYCKTNNIIKKDYVWDQNATRAGYMEIFADALPSSGMKEINTIPDGSIPDVPMSHPQSKAIYKLYRVGILQGNDLQHNCNPGANIKRSEVAAILTRMMDSSKRIQFSMDADALRFTKNPANVTVNPGETATLSVEVTGGKTPYKYQWSMSRDGAREQWYDVSGKTEATISVKTDASAAGATMAYRCKVTDAAGTTLYSDLGSITVGAKELRFTKNPAEVTVNPGETATLSVEVTGGKTPYKYQWSMSRDGAREQWYDVSGKTEATISVKTDASAAGATMAYRCKVTDAAGTTLYSDLGSITVGAKELKIKTQPADVEGESGQEVMLQVAVEGGKAPYTYTWKSGSTVINGRTDTRIRGGKDTVADGTSYTYSELYITLPNDTVIGSPIYCVVKDADGKEITSNSVTVTMKAKPLKIIDQPESVEASAGAVAEFFIEVEGGTYPYSFEWMAIDGQGGHATVEGQYGVQTMDDAGYGWSVMQMIVGSGNDWTTNEDFYCVVTDANGKSVTSNTFTITLKASLAIKTQPKSVTVSVNDYAEFTITVSGGTAPYSFQWQEKRSGTWYNLVNGDPSNIGFQDYSNGSTAECMIDPQRFYMGPTVRCVVTDANGNKVTSNEVKVTIVNY